MRGFERLLKLLEGSEKADSLTDVLTRGTEGGKGVEYVHIDFSCVGLAGDDVGGGEAGLFGNELIELFDLVVVAFENLEEGRLD